MNRYLFEDAAYVLPLRWSEARDVEELTTYLNWLSQRIQVLVVDGSPDPIFNHHASVWTAVRHIKPSPRLASSNGKVQGVLTGVSECDKANIVIADDDVRFDEHSLQRGLRLLKDCDIVRPQNYFSPMPWHAQWDSARSLLNRVSGGDWPGTLLVKRDVLIRTNGYDGESLFENLELVRTVRAAGGQEIVASDLFVRRLPPTAKHFLSQRVRQAYDEFARPLRLALQLAMLPIALAMLSRPGLLAISAGIAVLAAETGRQRARGSSVFPASASLFAPLWLTERMICAWAAVYYRLFRGGMPYAGSVIHKSASDSQSLRKALSNTPAMPVSK